MYDRDLVAEGFARFTSWFSHHELYDAGMASSFGPLFEESYAVRAAIRGDEVAGVGRPAAQAACDRLVQWQGAVEPDMYPMGYAYNRDAQGVPNCSCVADAASSAMAVLEAAQAYPHSPRRGVYLASVRRYADHVLDRYLDPAGLIGVGILGHRINPMPGYWCSNALFGGLLASLAEVTGEARYAQAAVAPMRFLATFDYTATDWNEWKVCPPQIILYVGEGLLSGLESRALRPGLSAAAATPDGPVAAAATVADAEPRQADNRLRAEADPARGSTAEVTGTLRQGLEKRWGEFGQWLVGQQEFAGAWPSPTERGYRDYQPALAWLIGRSLRCLGPDPALHRAGQRHLAYLLTPAARHYLGTFCRPFATAMAHLAFADAAVAHHRADPQGWAAALHAAHRRMGQDLW